MYSRGGRTGSCTYVFTGSGSGTGTGTEMVSIGTPSDTGLNKTKSFKVSFLRKVVVIVFGSDDFLIVRKEEKGL